jgi:hypothetical protein
MHRSTPARHTPMSGRLRKRTCNHFGIRVKETPSDMPISQISDEILYTLASSLNDIYELNGSYLMANETTTSKYVERVLELLTIPVCRKVKVPLQLRVNASKSNGVLDLAFIGQGSFAHPVTTAIETKAATTMQKGSAQCMAQMISIHEWNSNRGYIFDTIYGIVTNQHTWQFLRFSTTNQIMETSQVYSFAAPITDMDTHFALDQLKNSDVPKILGIVSQIITDSMDLVQNATPDDYLKRMWENDVKYTRKLRLNRFINQTSYLCRCFVARSER